MGSNQFERSPDGMRNSVAVSNGVCCSYIRKLFRMAHYGQSLCQSSCREEFKLLNGGDLYALERRSSNTEFFWLCSACACEFRVVSRPDGHAFRCEAGASSIACPPPHPDANLRLISRMMRPRPDTMPSGERASTFVSIDEPFSAAFRMRGGLES